ncbi:MAG: hypothetical protein WCS09_12825 [Pseudomonadota bacterium]
MKSRLILAAAVALALSGVGVAQAHDRISWSVSVGDPLVGAVISSTPMYRYGVPVYAPPPVVYIPAPRVIYPRPYVVVPYGYVPHRRIDSGWGRWDHRWRDEHARYDRHDWRDGDRRDGGDGDRGHRDERWHRR